MNAQEPILKFTQEAYDRLWLIAGQNPEIYLDPDTDFAQVLATHGIDHYVEPTGITTSGPISLQPASSTDRNQADHQAIGFYQALEGINPARATDQLMWSWLTHFKLHAYSLERWRRTKTTKLPDYIKAHWFAENQNSAIWNSNTAARTWWIAHTAIKAADSSAGAFTAQEALDHFAKVAVHYHILIRSAVMRSPILLAEFVRALLNEGQGIKAEAGGMELFRRINLEAGTRLLEVLPREEIRAMILDHLNDIMSKTELVSQRSKLRNRKPAIRSISLGAGVQSTVLALMADRGEHGLPKPDVAIFADTGWEPPHVYKHLDWLESQLSFDVVRVNNGNLRENIMKGINPRGNPYLTIPAFLVNPDGSSALASRQCTSDYKIKPIHDYLRQRLGLQYGRRAPMGTYAEVWMGISKDEELRAKPSRDEWIETRFPLVELEFNRAQLFNWFKEHYPDRYLPRSSCIGCPYHTNAEWKWFRDNDPESFQDAIEVDNALRNNPTVKAGISKKGNAYLHRLRRPLDEIDLSDTPDYDSLMLDECEGVCGI